jgi:predicted NBD/HSP70 family sugar kinase
MVKNAADPLAVGLADRAAEGFRVASSETARDINRRIALNVIRDRQPVSRADLARYSGMQPSTVSLIIEQLIAEKWVIEGPLGHLPRGRKPRYLRLNSSRAGIIGVDVRPSGTRVAIADLNAEFVAQETIATATDSNNFQEDLCRCVRTLMDSHPDVVFEGIGVSVPGRVDVVTHHLSFSANLGWRDVDLKTPLEQATGLPVELENAANTCALAEIWFGTHAPGERDLVIVTVSEGIGTGIIVDGQLVRGKLGLAGEFGHVTLAYDGPKCECGNRGCWELFASNSAAIRYYLEACGAGRAERMSPRDSVFTHRFEDILALAQQGDGKAGEALDRMAQFLGIGMATLITALTPSVVMVVGEVTRVWDRFDPILKKTIAERSLWQQAPRILPLEDFRQPRLRGAVALIIQKHFALPSGYSKDRVSNRKTSHVFAG